MQKIVAVCISAWLGMQLAVGYVVAPALFRHLPKTTAGNIAGELFAFVGWAGLAVWLAAYACCRYQALRSFTRRRSYTNSGIVLLWALLAVNLWVVTPVIAALKTDSGNWLLSLTGGSFPMWHGISSTIYLICSILALVLVWRLLRLEWR